MTRDDGERVGNIIRRALQRLWARDAMLYVGGVSFFSLLAIVPGLTLMVTLFGLIASPAHAERQVAALTYLLPPSAQALILDEVQKISQTSFRSLSLQSAVSAIVGLYAAHRGVKALLAGLQLIYAERKPRGLIEFNLLAMLVGVVAFIIGAIASSLFLAIRILVHEQILAPLKHSVLTSEWTWGFAALTLGLGLLYRYAMASHSVSARASAIAGAAAAGLTLAASYFCAVYVTNIVHLGATYGAIGAVMVVLIWLSWNVHAILFGAALATELEMSLDRRSDLGLAHQKD